MINRIRNKLSRRRLSRLAVIILYVVALAMLCSAQSGLNPRFGSLPKDEPQAIYHPDPEDSWNRIFYCLFTRTVKTRLSQDFSEGAPFISGRRGIYSEFRFSTVLFERIESGDGAIDPLYPASVGAAQALVEPRYSMLKRALADALGESRDRPALDRALMQGDVWAAFDILSGYRRIVGPQGESLDERRSELASLLARFIRKLALMPEEIKRLPDNYAAASGVHRLPDLFGPQSEWMEIKWLPNRHHDESFRFRRAARVFIKAKPLPANRQAFLNEFRGGGEGTRRIAAVALVIQSMLIDSNGAVVPSPITFEVQQRSFIKDGRGNFVKTELGQFEISRKLFLSNPRSGGLVALVDKSGSYLSGSGNDYSFASTQSVAIAGFAEPVYAALRTRCVPCHGPDIKSIVTFRFHTPEPPPPVEQLNPVENKHGNYVANRKMERDDFKALLREWTVQRN